MSDMSRREVVSLLALTPVTAAFKLSPDMVREARQAANRSLRDAHYEPTFFTPHEFATVTLLGDMIIPADERSGSASAAGAPQFIDFILTTYPSGQLPVRGGLAWLDEEMRRRTGKRFIDAAAADRSRLLDEIAFPARAKPELSHGVAFFTRMRDMVASAFFSSQVGVEDLQYRGNTFVPEWTGCPPEALAKLGVSY